MPDARDPVADLKRIAFLLEAMHEPSYRVRAFRGAAATLEELGPERVAEMARRGDAARLEGIGEVTERTILESLRGEEPVYLRRLEARARSRSTRARQSLRRALRGDCHAHTDRVGRRRDRSARWRRPRSSSATSTSSSPTTRRG